MPVAEVRTLCMSMGADALGVASLARRDHALIVDFALEVNGSTGPTSGLAPAVTDFGVGSGPGSATGAT
jgi:hypothetical protein